MIVIVVCECYTVYISLTTASMATMALFIHIFFFLLLYFLPPPTFCSRQQCFFSSPLFRCSCSCCCRRRGFFILTENINSPIKQMLIFLHEHRNLLCCRLFDKVFFLLVFACSCVGSSFLSLLLY